MPNIKDAVATVTTAAEYRRDQWLQRSKDQEINLDEFYESDVEEAAGLAKIATDAIEVMGKLPSLHENIAAISATFHTHSQYREFYELHKDALSGFTGIWQHCVELAEAFTDAEIALNIEWDGEWIEAISDFVEVAINSDSGDDLDKMALASIQQTLEWEQLPQTSGWKSWSREPGKAPVKAENYFVLEMSSDDDVENEATYYLMEDESWTALDRSYICTAKRFVTLDDAKKAFDGCKTNETVIAVEYSPIGELVDQTVLHEGR